MATIINNPANLPPSLVNPEPQKVRRRQRFAGGNGGWERGIKPSCLCNIPVKFQLSSYSDIQLITKWATAINGPSPNLSLKLSSVLEPPRDKNRRKILTINFNKLTIKNSTNVCI